LTAAGLVQKVNLGKGFSAFAEHWQPRVAGRVNDTAIKLVKLKGEFVWHHHDAEDELFLVVGGRLCMRFRTHEVWLEPGEFIIVPHGVEHCPYAPEECEVLLVEPDTTLNTGTERNERTYDATELTLS
jgi:mannose-6-phosphate isomerase-like protein (cupin superfamily)